LTVTDSARDARTSDPVVASRVDGTDTGRERDAQSRRGGFRGAGVTAGAAIVAGVLLLTRDQSVSTLGALAIVVAVLALIVTAASVREWPGAREWTGPHGALEGVAGPMAWLAMIFAAIVVLTKFVPVIVPAWSEEQVFAVAIVGFVILSVLGWGPGVAVAWPSGLRFSTLTVLGSIVALALVAVYLVFMLFLRADAVTADDQEWARLVGIQSTLEALAFAAAGALLGTVVQRQAVSGELRNLEDDVAARDAELAATQTALATRELEVDSLRANLAAAARLLTPGAPDDLDALDPGDPAVLAARPSSSAVRDARRAVLEGLRVASTPAR
jgi:hypothetical protein